MKQRFRWNKIEARLEEVPLSRDEIEEEKERRRGRSRRCAEQEARDAMRYRLACLHRAATMPLGKGVKFQDVDLELGDYNVEYEDLH